jgi:DNA polymerase-4
MEADGPFNWLFTDMNSFFASAEQFLRPELRGRPVGVVPVDSEYTCLIAASREAKRLGLKMGTTVREARAMCPDVAIVLARPATYVEMHRAILDCVNRAAPVAKVYSIDEWSVRLVQRERTREGALALGECVKREMKRDFGPWLTCSIGIAPTRLLAKIASDLQKPDGLTVLTPNTVVDRLRGIALTDLCGIGSGMGERLRRSGVLRVEDLWNLSRQQSVQIWGSVQGSHWWDGFHGIDEPEVPTRKSSMTHSHVLDPKLRHEEGARGILTRLVVRLGYRLRSDQYCAHGLSVFVKATDGTAFNASVELPCVQDTPTLLWHFQQLWERRTRACQNPKHVGVVVSGLLKESEATRPLFNSAHRAETLSRTMDTINDKWGTNGIFFGAMHGYRQHMDEKIAFGRIPWSKKPGKVG